ncbi:uncharacterized protein LOC143024760 [Oratosquilla oratoria]|uniref:uncharacterized protein LOC143024760 n=1 Tax=Oratosquilla oratoria TaxID=337810 RepID=UPI003F76B860
MVRQTSEVWKHFTSVKPWDGKEYFICVYCGQKYSPNATKMQKHLKKCPKCPLFTNENQQQQRVQLTQTLPSLTEKEEPSASGASSGPPPSVYTQAKKLKPMECLVDSIDPDSQYRIDESLARAIYVSGLPISLLTNHYWMKCFAEMRPAYQLPTQEALTTTLLEAEFKRIRDKVNQAVSESQSLAIISDGWSNTGPNNIINFWVSTPHPLYYTNVETRDNQYTGEYIADVLSDVIQKIGPSKVFAFLTDSTSHMKQAWGILAQLYPHITPISCSAQGLNILIANIMELATIQRVYDRTKDVIKYIKNHQLVSATFIQKQKNKHKPDKLILPDETRGGNFIAMLNSLLQGRESLQELAITDNLNIEKIIRQTLLDNDEFWVSITRCVNLLSPITCALSTVKTNSALLSDIPQLFANLQKRILNEIPYSSLTKQEGERIQEFLFICSDFCLKPIHAAANMVDPRYRGEILNDEQIPEAYSFISFMAQHLGLDTGIVVASLAKFRAKEGLWREEAVWQSAKHIPATTWWKGLCSSEAIAPLATILLGIPPTTMSLQQNCTSGCSNAFQPHGLSSDVTRKLTMIQYNLKLLDPQCHKTTNISESTHIDQTYLSECFSSTNVTSAEKEIKFETVWC